MRFGICCGPYYMGEGRGGVKSLMDTMVAAGADYLEFGVALTEADSDGAGFEKLRGDLESAPLKIEAFNGFIPGHHRITGPDVDFTKLMNFAQTALTRCKQIGGEIVVLGSGGARSLPEGFSKQEGAQQFIRFCRELGPVAEEIGITIAIEPLNSKEDNLITSVADGARIMDEVQHPRIRLLADLYHISQDKEPLQNTADAGGRLAHTHVADLDRVAPGFADEGEEDFLGFFRALRAAGYDKLGHSARCSFEGLLKDVPTQSAPLLSHLRRRWQQSV